MENKIDFEIIGPAIYTCDGSYMQEGFKMIMDYVDEGKIEWIDRRKEYHLSDMMFYPEEEGYHKEIYDYFDKHFTNIEKQYLPNFHTSQKKADFDKREFVYILLYFDSDWGPHHFDDHINEQIRRVSTVYYPNDDYEGGELEFPRFEVKLKPKKDQVLTFPSSFAFDHHILPITSGIRYIIGTVLG
jgi:Rps23 Pro-64 3,4-dihydroxylase Tpa1-like proline 4-hydroxylase